MKQVLVYPRIGVPQAYDVPDPAAQPGRVLIAVRASLISPGTERASLELHRAPIWSKARRRPDLVRQVIDKARTEGLVATARKARSRLAQPFTPGYSCAGTVTEVGPGVQGICVGERVAAAGFGYASHAEQVSVPPNLTAKIPGEVTFEQAAFATLGAIALHGVRVTAPAIGETVAVVGLGILGQLTAQILHAAGVQVVASEPDSFRRDLARRGGCPLVTTPGEPARQAIFAHTRGRGADAVIITAAATSDELVNDAAELARDRGVITVVGDVPLALSRRLFYEKELELRLSRSYGPGRYDRQYEELGHDYPYTYIRWTEQRNLEAFLTLLAQKQVAVDHLITDRFPIAQAKEAYRLVEHSDPGNHLAVLFEYAEHTPVSSPVVIATPRIQRKSLDGTLGVGFIGCGQFAAGVLLPAWKSLDRIRLTGVATRQSATAHAAAITNGFHFATTNPHDIINDPQTDVVVIAATHEVHAPLAIKALASGKAVFVEKPLALNAESLAEIMGAVRTHGARVQVGFNRRYAPALLHIKEALRERNGPLSIDYRICTGPPPPTNTHWMNDPQIGGGRLIGEVCHFIDAVMFLTDAHPRTVHAQALGIEGDDDAVVLTLALTDGSVAHIRYLTQTAPHTPKEHLDLAGGGVTAYVDDFRTYGWTTRVRRSNKRKTQNKGHREQLRAFIDALRTTGLAAGDFVAAVCASQATFAAQESLRRGEPVRVHLEL